MPSGRNPPGSGLESADSAEMRGDADRSAAVTAHPARRTSRRDCGRFPTTRSSSGTRQIPGIIGTPIEKIVRLPRHEQLGGVGHAQDDRSRIAQASHQRRVGVSDVSRTQFRPRLAAHSRHVNRTLDADGNAVQWAQILVLHHRRLSLACLSERSSIIKLHKSIDFRIQFLDPSQMRFNYFDGRNFPRANLSCDF